MPWDEAREVVALVATLAAAFMVIAPILGRLIDGQLDRNGFRSALTGAHPTAGLLLLGAAVLVATTPAADVTPALRSIVVRVSAAVCLVAIFAVLDVLFADAAGGVRHFFTRFPDDPAILWPRCALERYCRVGRPSSRTVPWWLTFVACCAPWSVR